MCPSNHYYRFGILINGSEVTIKALPHGKEIPPEFRESSKTCAIYELSATILQVKSDEKVPHLVAQVKGRPRIPAGMLCELDTKVII